MVRNKAAHSVSGHKAKSEYGRYKFNELDHENLPSLGGLESRCVCDDCNGGPGRGGNQSINQSTHLVEVPIVLIAAGS
jgi:hypothetical protein